MKTSCKNIYITMSKNGGQYEAEEISAGLNEMNSFSFSCRFLTFAA